MSCEVASLPFQEPANYRTKSIDFDDNIMKHRLILRPCLYFWVQYWSEVNIDMTILKTIYTEVRFIDFWN